MREKDSEFLVIQKTYDLVKYVVPQVHKFPRTYRFTLGEKLEGGVLDVLENLIEARYVTEERPMLLRVVNRRLEKLRYLLRLAHDFRILATGSYAFASRLVNEVGRLTGSWLRKVKG